MDTTVQTWQWILLIGSSILFLIYSPFAKTKAAFFKAQHQKKPTTTLLLTGSLVISWIFAKSITNAANLGLAFGLLGGLAYAGYYLSFAVAGWILYQMRITGAFKSIHEFLQTRYGRKAVLVFTVLILIRLFNEVWSNTMVIGSYFGEVGSSSYYTAIITFTLLTLSYAAKGGLSSSVFTDAIQMLLFSILLICILYSLFKTDHFSTQTVVNSSEWTMALGGNLLLTALVQSFSYPFHDPVLTDRAFIAPPKTTLKSFLFASVLGGLAIVLFSFIGIYAQQQQWSGQAAVLVAKSFGTVSLLLMNFIMISSAASTLDSTFASTAKLFVIDLKIGNTVTAGRITMLLMALLGSIPVFLDASILSATTISGTMVIGLAPIFLLWKLPAPKISFFLSVGAGLLLGILLTTNSVPASLLLTSGKYAALLWTNIWGSLICFLLYLIPIWIKKYRT